MQPETDSPLIIASDHGSMVQIGKNAKDEDMQQETITSPEPYVYLLACMACMNSLNLGYDVGSIGGASEIMKDEMNWTSLQTEFFVASANFLAIGGAMTASYLCDGLGRRKTFTVSCCVFIFGLLLIILSPSNNEAYTMIMIGRVCTGFGIGLGLAIDPLYIAEISPSQFRGQLVSFSEISVNAGILIGMIADFSLLGLHGSLKWRLMIGLGMLMPSILLVLSLTILPESPRWLIANGQKEEAMVLLKKTHHPSADVDAEAAEIEAQIEFDAEVAATGWDPIINPTPAVKRMLLAGVGLGACQQVNGSEAFIYYTPSIMENAGFTKRKTTFALTLLIGFCKTAGIFIGAGLVDNLGRRPLIFTSCGLMTFFLLLIAVSFPTDTDGWGGAQVPICIIAMCGFVASFSVGMGPVAFLGASEVFPLHIRAKALSLATSTNRLVSALVAGTTLSLSTLLTSTGFFVFYAILTAMSAFYLYKFFPETKGLSLEEVTALFDTESKGRLSSTASVAEPTGNPLQEDPGPTPGKELYKEQSNAGGRDSGTGLADDRTSKYGNTELTVVEEGENSDSQKVRLRELGLI